LKPDQIAVSPCCNPELTLPEILSAYSGMGYRSFEVFTTWVKSAADFTASAESYCAPAKRYGMSYHSLHLPPIKTDDFEATFAAAVAAAEFAAKIGATIVLYKADTRAMYIKAAGRFLDAIDGLGVTPVVQNHFGTAVTTLDDVKEVHEGIADKRMKALLEVGHFHTAGVTWRSAAEYLGDSVVLIHIKDQIKAQSVAFGKGEIDLPGLFKYMDRSGYTGKYIVEMEVQDRENTLNYLKDAYRYMIRHCSGAA
jgi:sugar phosphate isomerase/epimerase